MSLLPLAALIPEFDWVTASAADAYLFFTAREADVVREATARLIPGPEDDPLEAGHPGAREADVVRYIDTLLSALSSVPERIHAGGPHGVAMTRYVPLSPAQRLGWQRRLARLRTAYRAGVPLLDEMAGGDFAAAGALEQDRALASAEAAPFRDVLFVHAIEGTYSHPTYGGNANRSGWIEIGFPGESQPRGYAAAEVSRSDGPDPLDPTGIVAIVLANFETAARGHR